MKKYLLLFLTCLGANAATLQFYMTNSLGQPDTNWFQVIPVGSPILANGGFNTKGIAIKCFPNTNGFFQTNLNLGNYLVTNKFLGTGSLISVPDSPLTFNAAQPGVAISGFNTYNYSPGVQRLTSSDGSVTMTPANGMGTVDLKSGGAAVAPGQLTTTATNSGVVSVNVDTSKISPLAIPGNARLLPDWSIWDDTNGNYYALSADMRTLWRSNDFAALFQRVHDSAQQEYGLTIRMASIARDGTNIYPYYVSNTIYLYRDGLNIIGEGNSSCVIRPAPGMNAPIFQCGTTANAEDGICRFVDLRFEGVGAGALGVAVLCTNVAEPNFIRCEFNQFPLAGIRISGTNGNNENWCFLQNCWFVGAIGITNAACILVDAARATVPAYQDYMELLIRDCDFGLNGGGSGIVVSNQFQHITVQDCRFLLAPVANPTNTLAMDFRAGDRINVENNSFQWAYGGTPINFASRPSPTNINSQVTGNLYDGPQPFVTVGANVLGLTISGNHTNGVISYSGDGSGLSNLTGSAVTGTVPAATTATTMIQNSTPAQALVGDDGTHKFTITIPAWLMTNYINGPLFKLWNKDFSDLLAGTNTWAGDNITSGNWTNNGTWKFNGLLSSSFFTTTIFTNGQGQYGLWGPSAYDGSSLTNLKSANTVTVVSGGSVVATLNTNGSTNFAITIAGGGGGGGTNSGPIVLTLSGTNAAVVASTPVGCATNAVLPYRLTLTTNALIQNPTGMLDGQRVSFELIQDATGGRTVYFDTAFAFGTDLPASVVNGYDVANKRSFVTATYNSGASKWYVVGYIKGF